MKNTVSKQRFTPSNVFIVQLSHLVGVTRLELQIIAYKKNKVKTLLLLLFISFHCHDCILKRFERKVNSKKKKIRKIIGGAIAPSAPPVATALCILLLVTL